MGIQYINEVKVVPYKEYALAMNITSPDSTAYTGVEPCACTSMPTL